MLKVNNIKKSFDNNLVLDGINLYVDKGEFVSILGVSGSGKTTIFNIIAGLIKPDGGNIYVNGKDITGKTGIIGYMQQNDLLLPWKNIYDNVTLPLTIKGEKKANARKIAGKYMPLFGLEGYGEKYPKELSGGMRQRAALLRTYLFSGEIMLLDEPFAKLDAITKRKLQNWLSGVVKKMNITTLLVTHDVEEAILLSDRIYIISDKPATIKREFTVSENAKNLGSAEFYELQKSILNTL